MRNACFFQHFGNFLGDLDGNCTHQNGLSLFIGFLDRIHDGAEFFFFGLVDGILIIKTDDRAVGRDLNDIHAVNLAELALLGESRTGHAALFIKLVEEVLEGDRCQSSALALDFDMLLGLDCLMQAVRVTAAGHYTAGELVDDQDLVVLDDIVVVPVHEVVGAQGQDNAVLNLEVLGIRQVFDAEEALDFGDALCCQIDEFVFFIDNEIAGLFTLDAHDGIDLGKILNILAAFHLAGKNIACLVDLGGLAALTGNDQRRSCFVDEDGVDLVDDGIVELTENELLLIDGHIVPQVIETQLVIGYISNIAGIGLLALLGRHAVEDNTDGHSHETVDLTHPLRVTLCQIIVDCDDVDAAALQSIEVGRHGRDQRLTFTGAHFGDTALMKNDAADQLYAERFHIECAARSFADCRIGFDQKIIQRLALLISFPEFFGFSAKFLIGERLHLRT